MNLRGSHAPPAVRIEIEALQDEEVSTILFLILLDMDCGPGGWTNEMRRLVNNLVGSGKTHADAIPGQPSRCHQDGLEA
jgi:hypothetical protein